MKALKFIEELKVMYMDMMFEHNHYPDFKLMANNWFWMYCLRSKVDKDMFIWTMNTKKTINKNEYLKFKASWKRRKAIKLLQNEIKQIENKKQCLIEELNAVLGK